MTMLAWLWQRCHHNEGNICHCNDGKDACASTARTPSQWGQQCHRDDGKDACALIMMKTPLQWGQQCQLEDNNDTILMRETALSRIKGNAAIVMRAMMPAQWQQGHLRIDNGNKAIVMRQKIAMVTMAKMPAHQRGWHHRTTTSDKENNTISTTLEMPAHWQWQQCHHDKNNNCHGDNGKDACASMAMAPSWWGQQCQLDNEQRG